MTACTYAWFSWIGVSCASYQYCQYWRSKEKDGIRQMKELMEKKRANVEAKRAERRRLKEEQDQLAEEQRKEEARKKSWSYWFNKNTKFW
jgi:cytochrome c oxidase assembly protein subunit 20